jgi:hypothetical protein
MTSCDTLTEYFRLPIYYNNKKVLLKDNISTDLELVKTIDNTAPLLNNDNIYSFAFNTQDIFGKNIINDISTYYTDDILFLKDSQKLLKTYSRPVVDNDDYASSCEQINVVWNEIKKDTGFKEKYNYVNWSMWEFLNSSEQFLQVMSVYNIASPAISIFMPCVMLIIPFFIIKIKGISLSIDEYIKILKVILTNHALGKVFTQFDTIKPEEKVYIIASLAFYLFSIYQNILTCVRFHINMKKIHSCIHTIKQYIDSTTLTMKGFLEQSSSLTSYDEFNKNVTKNMVLLDSMSNTMKEIGVYNLSFSKMFTLGHILKTFYELYDSKVFNDAIMYSFGFNGYISIITGLSDNIRLGKINFANIKRKGKTVIKGNYYACLINKTHVKNDVKLKKNIIITGPNASGKTTILKSTLINVILTQQFGCGFYDSCEFSPYKYIHSYLNIPDTSGRDSLFQSESRRCKEIIDCIREDSKSRHLCVFDELFSGTNPEEAEISSSAFMEYIVKYKRVSCLLTTHFVKVCKNLDSNVNIMNYHMLTIKNNCSNNHTYLLKKGISEVKGGVQVLFEMDFPKEIIDSTKKQFC